MGKTKKSNNNVASGSKQWRKNGDEDKAVINLIKRGKVTKRTSATDLQKMNPILFGSFSEQVVRNHLSELKRANGVFCKYFVCFC